MVSLSFDLLMMRVYRRSASGQSESFSISIVNVDTMVVLFHFMYVESMAIEQWREWERRCKQGWVSWRDNEANEQNGISLMRNNNQWQLWSWPFICFISTSHSRSRGLQNTIYMVEVLNLSVRWIEFNGNMLDWRPNEGSGLTLHIPFTFFGACFWRITDSKTSYR